MLAGKRVLIVEDEPLIAVDLETAVLDAGGVIIARAATLEQALALAENDTFDGAILDLHLGADSSLEVLNTLQRRSIACVVHTGQSVPEFVQSHPEVVVFDKPSLPELVIAALAAEITKSNKF